jgi:hypothetical protein
MTPEYWEKLQDLFCKAVDLPGAERSALLDQECRDEAMRTELESMLRHDTRGNESLKDAIRSAARAVVAVERDRELLGRLREPP